MLKAEKERLFRVVDSLNRQNQMMSQTLDSTNVVLEERTKITRFPTNYQSEILTNKVDKASQLKITSLRGEE